MIYSKFIKTHIYQRANGVKSVLQTLPLEQGKQIVKNGLKYAPELEPVLSPIPITIRPATNPAFQNKKYAFGLKNFVQEPWTAAQNVYSKNAATENIMECTSAGIIGPQKIKMTHINPHAPLNSDFSTVADEFVKNTDLTDYSLRGFVLGSLDYAPDSRAFFKKFCNLFKALRIPFSSMKTGEQKKFSSEMSTLEKYFGIDTMGHNIAYSSKNKELLINNRIINQNIQAGETNAGTLLNQSFDEIKLLNTDKIVFKNETDKHIKPKGKLFQKEEKINKERAKAALDDIDIQSMYYEAIQEALPKELQECKDYAQSILS